MDERDAEKLVEIAVDINEKFKGKIELEEKGGCGCGEEKKTVKAISVETVDKEVIKTIALYART